MRTIFGVKSSEAILFLVCAVAYLALWALWTVAPFAADAAGRSMSIADSNIALPKGTPLIGDLPGQSVSKLVICVGLYLIALIYGLIALATSEYRRYLPQIVVIGILTFLAWVALNLWVIAGFLNASWEYGLISVLLLVAWGGAIMFGVARVHDATALFLVRFGLGLSMFMTIVQIIAVLTPEWRSPTQGVPVLYNLTFNALVGIFLAGAGGNMLWREKRAQTLAAAAKRR